MQNLLVIFVVLLLLLIIISTLGGSIRPQEHFEEPEEFWQGSSVPSMPSKEVSPSVMPSMPLPGSEPLIKEVEGFTCSKERFEEEEEQSVPVTQPPQVEQEEEVVEGFDGDMYAAY